MKLSKDQIVSEAIALLQERGLKEVSLRNLAERLNVKAPSLFWYIRNKSELLALIDEHIFRECLLAIPACSIFTEWLRHYGLVLWDAQCRAPDIPNLITRADLSEEVRHSLHGMLEAQLTGFGVDMALAMRVQASVQALVTGWTVLSGLPGDGKSGDSSNFSPEQDSFREGLDALIRGWEPILASVGLLPAR